MYVLCIALGDPGDLHPWLKIAVESNDTSESTELFDDRAPNEVINIAAPNFSKCLDTHLSHSEISPPSIPAMSDSEAHDRHYIYVELDSEVEFFNMLTTDMNNAMALSEQVQREQFETDVSKLEKQIAVVVIFSFIWVRFSTCGFDALTTVDLQASPNCKDMYIWREIFRLYIERKIFQGTASVEKSKDKMQGFVEEIETMKLVRI